MPRFTVDLREAVTFEAVEDGTYDVEIKDFAEPKTGGSGDPYTRVQLEIVGGGDGSKEVIGKKISPVLMLAGKGTGLTKNLLVVAGLADKDTEELPDFDSDDLVGLVLRAKVTKTEYPEDSGEFTNEVKRFYPKA